MPAISTIPDGHHTVSPYLIVRDVPACMAFLRDVFAAVELRRTTLAGGGVRHARMRIGDSVVMIGRAGDDQPPFPAVLYLYLDDVDGLYRRALAHGAQPVRAPAAQPYGEYNAGVRDPFGNQWWVAVPMKKTGIKT